MFFKADIQLDKNGNIKKISSGDKVSVPFQTISPKDIEIGGFLGQGTAATVNEGIFKPTNYPVAIKKVNVYDDVKRKQLLNDLKLLVFDPEKPENICPYLVQLFGAYFEGGNIMLILELMDVGSLKDLIKMFKQYNDTEEGFPEPVISYILKEALEGLAYLHHKTKRIHRDIKPANILLNTLGQVKITDFGISKQLNSTNDKAGSWVGTLSFMYLFQITHIYRSPERIQCQGHSFPTDIWSLGIVAYEMATGHFPFPKCKTVFQSISHIVKSKPIKLPENYSIELKDIVQAMLWKDPDKRPNALQLLNHPFIKNYSKIKKDEIAQWISPMIFSYVNNLKKKQKEARNPTYESGGMVEEMGEDGDSGMVIE